MNAPPPPDRLLAPVRRALAEAGVKPGETLLVAVSGGLDSTVLLHLLAALRAPLGFDLRAAHLHHGLRGEDADADAAFAADTGRRLGVPVTVARRTVRPRPGESLQAAARRVRYRFLFAAARRAGATRIATAHHADDLAETVLLRMLAGAGSGGLAAMAGSGARPGSKVLRPLLGVRKADLAAFARSHGIGWREDPSNHDRRFSRARVRADLLPALEALEPEAVPALVREARILADEADYLDRAAAAAWVHLERREGEIVVLDRAALCALHPALARRGLARLLETLVPGRVGSAHVEALLDLARGATGRHADLPGGVAAEASYGALALFREADLAPAAAEPVPLRVPGVTPVPWAGLAVEARYGAPVPAEGWVGFDPATFSGPLTLRPRLPGDRFRPAGLGGERKLKRYLIDRKVPRRLRDRTPLLVAPEGILWVVGMRQDERFVVKGRQVPARNAAHPLVLRVLPSDGRTGAAGAARA